ncbi:MAG TPA: MmcQ/YjbR family DNA-binding protein [Thermomicrobiales bacterium]
MGQSSNTAEARFATIVEALLGNPGVTPPAGTGFGASGLKVGGKIFAMLSSKGEFVVKLPKARVDALIASGDGERFDPGHGRLMKEWLAVEPTSEAEWLPLAREAMAFVAAQR